MVEEVLRDIEIVFFGLFFEDGDTCFEVGRLNINAETPLEAGNESVLKALESRWSNIAGENDLFAILIKGVEDVEELFLG